MKKRTFRNTSKAKLSRMSLMGHKKGIEMSINMLVIIALAVFVLFLIIGFVLGGFDFFRKIFFGLSTQPTEVLKTRCQTDITNYQNSFGSVEISSGSVWDEKLCQPRQDFDKNGDNVIDANDEYNCGNYVDVSNLCPAASAPI